jgi:hypothetical protein
MKSSDADFAAVIVSSPPYAGVVQHNGGPALQQGGKLHSDYGQSPGQLGAMPVRKLDAAISSPPYIDARQGWQTPEGAENIRYGESNGQLSQMPEGAFSAAVSSPPWEGCLATAEDDHMEHGAAGNVYVSTRGLRTRGGDRTSREAKQNQSDLNGKINLGSINTFGNNGKHLDTFWTEAKKIVAQTYAALRPGGHAIWIVKSFVRNKALVDFPGQWRALCESVGFVTLHEHHAMLVDDKGTQTAIDGNHKQHKTERKSFFRRLAEKKGSPEINFETVYCMIKR